MSYLNKNCGPHALPFEERVRSRRAAIPVLEQILPQRIGSKRILEETTA